MHKFVANVDTGLRMAQTLSTLRFGMAILENAKQGHVFRPFLAHSAPLFADSSIYQCADQTIGNSAAILNPDTGTAFNRS